MTITEALQEGAMLKKAATLFTSGGYVAIPDPVFDGWYDVKKADGTRYSVRLDGERSSCSCPCFESRGKCKHLYGMQMEVERDEAMIAQYEAKEFGRFAAMSDAAEHMGRF